jgi:hypothetical protein
MANDNNFDTVKLFFSKMKCSNCQNLFKEEDITVLRCEGDYTVVRVYCSHCDKNIGIALLGLDRQCMKKSLEEASSETIDNQPISYDDVIDAHSFFSSLSDDWLKFIPQEYKH